MDMLRSLLSSMLQSPRVLADKLLLAISFFAFIGFADSAYLTAGHYFSLPLPCSITHGCEAVLRSSYSMVGPIPLAAIGVVFYLLVLFIAIHLYTSETLSRTMRLVLVTLCTVGLGMSIIFEGIQIFIIHAICQYCALSALCSLGLCVAGAVLARRIPVEA